jgi:hypothetical protein
MVKGYTEEKPEQRLARQPRRLWQLLDEFLQPETNNAGLFSSPDNTQLDLVWLLCFLAF